jgi:hypothetical protein
LNLPESFRRYGAAVLAKHPEVQHEWTTENDSCELSIPTSSSSGFDIRFEVESDAVTLCWGNWHTRFEPTGNIDTLIEHLYGLLRDMLSPNMRIRELYAGSRPYKGLLESFDGTNWSTEYEMALIFWNYFGPRSARTFSNSILPGRKPQSSG